MAADLHCGHVLDVLREMPDEHFHCCITSPPYWGLRDYGIEPVVWGGDLECEHVWGHVPPARSRSVNDIKDPNSKEATKSASAFDAKGSQFCTLCGAWRGNLGLEPSPELYVEHLVEIFREIRRVLRDDGVCFVNLGDSYAGSGQLVGKPSGRVGGGRRRLQQLWETQGHIPRYIPEGLKPKDLCMMPARVALALQADGWWVRSWIVWAKAVSFCPTYSGSTMPESCQDRPTTSHEYVLFLSKSGKSTFWTHRDLEGVRKRPKPDYRWVNQITGEELTEAPADWKVVILCPVCEGTGEVVVRSVIEDRLFDYPVESHVECEKCKGEGKLRLWKRVNLWRGHDYFYDGDAVREQGSLNSHGGGRVDYSRKTSLGIEGRNTGCLNTKPAGENGRNLRSVWTINPQAFPDAHFATFPEALVEPMIRLSTSEKGVCPKCGAPWARVVSLEGGHTTGRWERNRAKMEREGKFNAGIVGHAFDQSEIPAKRTIDWRPTCTCDAGDPIPATVLDPFCGRGTVGVVCKRLGRDFTGIDIKQEYIEMAEREIRKARTQQFEMEV